MSYIKLARILTYLGLIPFLIFSLGIFFGYNVLFEFKVFAALILSFLGGINWGIAMINKNSEILLKSIISVGLCWLLFLIDDNTLFLTLLASLYLLQIYLDNKIKNLGFYDKWFINLRMQATLGVIFFIIIALVGNL